MRLFWKINIYTSLIVLGIFLLYVCDAFLGLNKITIMLNFFGLVFIFSPFLEIIQIPLCLLVTLFTLKRQKKIVWVYFLIMILSFLIKIIAYVSILGSIIPHQ